jgi:predicted ATPase
VPLPRPLERTARPVGRDTQLRRLEEVWADAASGTLRVAVLAGEPGIGKTTLVGELARRVHARGAVVLYGRCDEEPLLPYQPFVEAVERLLEAMPPEERELRLEQRDGALRRLLPGSGPSTSGHDGATARYLLFEAVRALVEEVAHDRSLLLVLDDPHWGDEGTLALLRHLVRTASHRRLLVVLCIRPAELNPGSAAMLADLRREGPQVDVPLEGLDTAAVDTLLEARIGSHERDLAERLRRRTGGNPLFLDELLRDAEGRPDGTPPTGLQEVVARRSARLGPAAHATLELAAVIGLEFDVSLAAAALAEDPAAVLERLDGAVATQLVVPTGQPDRLAFAHALVAEALLARLPPSRRARLHLAVADALEGRPTPEARRRAAELVRHLRAAGPLAPAGRLVAAELEAARQAENAVAHAEAARHLEAAVERLRATTDGTDVPAILARAGQAHARAGHAERAREVFGELAASARALHDPSCWPRPRSASEGSASSSRRPTRP